MGRAQPTRGGKQAAGPGGGGKGSKGSSQTGGSAAGKAARKSASSSSSSSRSGGSRRSARRAPATPSLGAGTSNVFSRLGKLGSEEAADSGAPDKKRAGSGTSSSSSRNSSRAANKSSPKASGKGKSREGEGGVQEGGVTQMLAAVGDSFSAGAAAFQERFSEIKPQNVTLLFGGGKVANVTVPWKSVGIYGGGLLSGLALAAGLLTVPYTELGSPGLRKSLTLFENVLVDIDQVGGGCLL